MPTTELPTSKPLPIRGSRWEAETILKSELSRTTYDVGSLVFAIALLVGAASFSSHPEASLALRVVVAVALTGVGLLVLGSTFRAFRHEGQDETSRH